MISYDEALQQVLASVDAPADSELLPLQAALGRYLAEDIQAQIDVPGFANSAMDGYAVRAAEIRTGKPMPVSQRIAAGNAPEPLQQGSVARIFTGAMLPDGADAVVLQEDSSIDESGRVAFTELPIPGQHIRPAGQDIARGSRLVEAGKRLAAVDIALAASVGTASLPCRKPLRVAFFSTGDELRQPGEPLQGAQIYNSNRYLLDACLRELGMVPVDLGCCADEPAATRSILQQASQVADCVLTTGGMSVGEEDYVRSEAEKLGSLQFWKIAMKPGKPFAMGQINGTPFFGLPGNPVSTYVTFQLLVRPWLLKTLGAAYLPRKEAAIAQNAFENRGGRLDFVRVRTSVNPKGLLEAEIYNNQSSGVLSSISWANALLPVPPRSQIVAGDRVELWSL